jgi:uncharacterized protein YjbJ (UPF0337 family)
MSWIELRARWTELSGEAAHRWERLTARDLRVIAGRRERLVGVLQQRYGVHRRAVEREVRAFTRSLRESSVRDKSARRSEAATGRRVSP